MIMGNGYVHHTCKCGGGGGLRRFEQSTLLATRGPRRKVKGLLGIFFSGCPVVISSKTIFFACQLNLWN